VRNFLAFFLALGLGFLGAMVLSHTPTGLTAHEDVGIETLAKMTSLESTQSIAGEQPSIRMEILMPEIVLAIPNQKLGRWTSKTIDTLISTNPPIPISLWKYASLLPELVTPEGQVLQPQAPLRRGEETPRCFVHGAGTMTFAIFTRLFRENNKLKLTFYEPFGDSGWYFDALKPGTYQLRFTYQYCGKAVSGLTPPPTTEGGRGEEFGVGRCATQFVNLRLVQP
jgi:hypothetical protein